MKKPARLLLRKETLRTLCDTKLTRVVAGADQDTIRASEPTDLKHCPVAAGVVATGG